jgi:hypothetical protein
VREREAAVRELMEAFEASDASGERERAARLLGGLRAAEAAPVLVRELVRLHRGGQSPLRDPESPLRPLAVTLADALRAIGRPGLEPFLDALAGWDGFALDLTWAFVSVHGEEGILVLRHRAETDPNPERRARLEAAVFFTRLRAPEVQESGEAPPADQ